MSKNINHWDEQFKQDAIGYVKEHPELSHGQCAENLGGIVPHAEKLAVSEAQQQRRSRIQGDGELRFGRGKRDCPAQAGTA